METIMIRDCKFVVDKIATANFVSEYNAPCNCAYCRNYFQTVHGLSAVLDFLSLFSVNVDRPEECIESGLNKETGMLSYSVWYSVVGVAEQSIKIQLAPDVMAEILLPDTNFAPNTDHKESYFWLCLDLRLPWGH